MTIIAIVHVCIITNDKTVHWIFFWNTDNLFVVTNIFKAKPVALYVFRYLYQLLHMHSIKDIYHVYIHLSSGILKLKKEIKLILSLEMHAKKLEKKISGVCWTLFLHKHLFKLGDWKICTGISVKTDITTSGHMWLFRFRREIFYYCIYSKRGISFLNNCLHSYVWYYLTE